MWQLHYLLVATLLHFTVVVALGSEPRQVGLGGDTRIHHHRGSAWRTQAGEHVLERGGVTGIARQHPAAARESAAVQHHSQGDEWAVAAALLAVPALGLAHACGNALEVGVGPVVQGDRLAKAQEGLCLREQVVLQGLARCLYSASEARYRRF